MVAQAIVEQRGYCVMEPDRAAWCCGRCRTVEYISGIGTGNGGTKSQLDCWLILYEQHHWHYTEYCGLTCPKCSAIVAPWVVDEKVGKKPSYRDGYKVAKQSLGSISWGSEAEASRLRGGQVTSQRRATAKKHKGAE